MAAIAGMVLDFGLKMLKRRSDFNKNLETLERNVKLLSDKASDVKTSVENRERSGKKKRKREVDSWFVEVMKVEERFCALKEEVTRGKKNGGSLEKINRRVEELREQSKHFGTLVHDMYESEECLLLAPEVHEEKLKHDLQRIWTWLRDGNVSRIGIYGMGGVDKTTLVKHIHNRLVKEVRYHVSYVTVSQGFSIKRLQDDLAKIVNLDLSGEVDEQIRAAKLCRAFKEGENIVIILDDIWDRLSLEKLGDHLGVEGCRLILTTRSYEVCQKMRCQEVLEVKKLNTYDAWELSQSTLRGLNCTFGFCDDIEWIINVPSGRNTTTDPQCICYRSLRVKSLPNLVGLCKGNIASHTFSGLTKFALWNCHKMKKLFPRAVSQDLKNLEMLEVNWCEEMEEIIAEEATDQNGSSQLGTSSDILILPKLKQLELWTLPKLKSICEGKLICDSLETMDFFKCPKLKRLPFYAPTTNAHLFPALEKLGVRYCDEMEEIIAEEATDQDGSSQLSTSSDILILPKLKELTLFDLPKLKRICEGKLICDSLETMNFFKCPKLKGLPLN